MNAATPSRYYWRSFLRLEGPKNLLCWGTSVVYWVVIECSPLRSTALIDNQRPIDWHIQKHRDMDARVRTNIGQPITCYLTSIPGHETGINWRTKQWIDPIGHSFACTWTCEPLTSGIAAVILELPNYTALSVISDHMQLLHYIFCWHYYTTISVAKRSKGCWITCTLSINRTIPPGYCG